VESFSDLMDHLSASRGMTAWNHAPGFRKGRRTDREDSCGLWEPPASAIYAVYPGNRLMSLKIRAFVDHLARCFGKPPYWHAGL
jgi:DNA-binding transcriptional LysR family regulator